MDPISSSSQDRYSHPAGLDQQIAKVSEITSATEGAAEVTGVLPVPVDERPDEAVSWLTDPTSVGRLS